MNLWSWAGAPDPAELFEQNKAEDPQKVGREVLLEAWRNVYGSEPQQLKKVLLDADQVGHIACRARLGDAISDLVPINRLTSKSLSTLLQKFQNQWIGDFRIRKAPPERKLKVRSQVVCRMPREGRRAAHGQNSPHSRNSPHCIGRRRGRRGQKG